jgi:hypothetical protein
MFMGFLKVAGTETFHNWFDCPDISYIVWRNMNLRQIEPLVHEGSCLFESGNILTNHAVARAFIAKDRATLISALKVCPPALKVTVKEGDSIGYVVGSYDHEKLGGSITNKISGLTGWKDFKGSEKGQKWLEVGGTKKDYMKVEDRRRLYHRGYFILAAPLVQIRNYKRHVGLHDVTVPLCSFVGLLSGKMGREEAVDRLFEDLLVT